MKKLKRWVWFWERIGRFKCRLYGYIYNPEYLKIGAYEDWDNGRRLLELGYGFARCSLIDVWHEGMGTRKNFDTSNDQIYNSNIYHINQVFA